MLAQEEARLLGHNYIGTEHLLLGLLHEGEGVASRALRDAGVQLDNARSQVLAIVGEGAKPPSGHIPFTPRAKTALELSLRQSLNLRRDQIGTEHLLLALVKQGEGVAVNVLLDLDVDLDTLRISVMDILSGRKTRRPKARGQRRATAGDLVELGSFPDWVEETLGASQAAFAADALEALLRTPAEAEAIGSEYLGSEHLMFAVTRPPDGIPAAVMSSLGIHHDRLVAEAARKAMPKGPKQGDRLILAEEHLADALAFAVFEAGKRGARSVGLEHLLLGLLRASSGVAALVLDNVGGGLEAIWDETLRLIDEAAGEG